MRLTIRQAVSMPSGSYGPGQTEEFSLKVSRWLLARGYGERVPDTCETAVAGEQGEADRRAKMSEKLKVALVAHVKGKTPGDMERNLREAMVACWTIEEWGGVPCFPAVDLAKWFDDHASERQRAQAMRIGQEIVEAFEPDIIVEFFHDARDRALGQSTGMTGDLARFAGTCPQAVFHYNVIGRDALEALVKKATQ